jgi:hypothetical protein
MSKEKKKSGQPSLWVSKSRTHKYPANAENVMQEKTEIKMFRFFSPL